MSYLIRQLERLSNLLKVTKEFRGKSLPDPNSLSFSYSSVPSDPEPT